MIKNIPNHSDFEKIGIQCLCKAFEIIFQVGDRYLEKQDYIPKLEEDISITEFWESHIISINTSLILSFQGLESLMKMEVSKESPLLLIENSKEDWPTTPNKRNKDFNELNSISGEKLLNVFFSVNKNEKINKDFVNFYTEFRILRNKMIHGVGNDNINPKTSLFNILKSFEYFKGNYSWIYYIKEFFINEPIFGIDDYSYEFSKFYRVLNFTEFVLGKATLNKFIEINIKARRYFCPNCTTELKKYEIAEKSKWSFLVPNTSDSTKLSCLICSKEYEVKRKNCEMEDCKGNVISNDSGNICLTCFDEE